MGYFKNGDSFLFKKKIFLYTGSQKSKTLSIIIFFSLTHFMKNERALCISYQYSIYIYIIYIIVTSLLSTILIKNMHKRIRMIVLLHSILIIMIHIIVAIDVIRVE